MAFALLPQSIRPIFLREKENLYALMLEEMLTNVSDFECLLYLVGRQRLSMGIAARLWIALYSMVSWLSFLRTDNCVQPSPVRSDVAEVV